MYITSQLQTKDTVDLGPGQIVEFGDDRGRQLSVDHPLTKAILAQLRPAWPASVAFESLLFHAREVFQRLSSLSTSSDTDDDATATACELLLRAYQAGLVELEIFPQKFAATPSDRPVASPLARLDAREKAQVTTNLKHRDVALDDEFVLELLPHLDGSSTMDDLKLQFQKSIGEETFDKTIKRLAELALLIR
jgi:hypothetical protein